MPRRLTKRPDCTYFFFSSRRRHTRFKGDWSSDVCFSDLAAWHDRDPSLVHVGILGPVQVEAPGEEPTERQRFLAEIIVYLAQRGARGTTADRLTDADRKSVV